MVLSKLMILINKPFFLLIIILNLTFTVNSSDLIFKADFHQFTQNINDTGIDWGGDYPDGNNLTCTSNISSPQDCHQGRDATNNNNSDGNAGFSFTKLDENGNALNSIAGSWSCIRDDVTNLVWEVKTDDGGIHDKDISYRWGGITHVGNFGTEFFDDWDVLVNGSNNGSGLCGFTNWRVPTLQELKSIVDLGNLAPAIDSNFFPNTLNLIFWTNSPEAFAVEFANSVSFFAGHSNRTARTLANRVRLVRTNN